MNVIFKLISHINHNNGEKGAFYDHFSSRNSLTSLILTLLIRDYSLIFDLCASIQKVSKNIFSKIKNPPPGQTQKAYSKETSNSAMDTRTLFFFTTVLSLFGKIF